MRVSKVYDGTDPGGNLGRTFDASIGQETIVPFGKNLAWLTMGMRGQVSTGAVAIETFADELSEYTLRVGAQTRILADLQDLCALMVFFFGKKPTVMENTDATGNAVVAGVKVPVFAPASTDAPITHAAENTGQTNITNTQLAISAYWEDDLKGQKPIHAVKIAHTSAGSAGYETLSFRIAPVGKLIGVIIGQATILADGDIDVSIQRLKILVDGEEHSHFTQSADGYGLSGLQIIAAEPLDGLLQPYLMFDLRPSGIDAKGKQITLQIDVQDVSDAVDIIPVLEVE